MGIFFKKIRATKEGAGWKTEFLSRLAHARGHFRVSRVSLEGLRKRETARSLQHLHRKRETRIYFEVG